MNQCPFGSVHKDFEFDVFRGSVCNLYIKPGYNPLKQFAAFLNWQWKPRSLNPREFIVLCDKKASYFMGTSEIGQCRRDEMCFNSLSTVAWCVSGQSFLSFIDTISSIERQRRATILLQKREPGERVKRATTNSSETKNGKQVVIMLYTQNNSDTLFQAQEMSIAARDVNNQTLGQTVSCKNCSYISLPDPPVYTQNFDFNLTFWRSDDRAFVKGWVLDWL